MSPVMTSSDFTGISLFVSISVSSQPFIALIKPQEFLCLSIKCIAYWGNLPIILVVVVIIIVIIIICKVKMKSILEPYFLYCDISVMVVYITVTF